MGAVPLEQLQLLKSQDMALVSREDSLAMSIWSTNLGTDLPLANGVLEAMQHVLSGQA
jgi:hypothetical protein